MGDRKDDYAPLVRGAAAGDREAMDLLLKRAQEVAFRFSFLVCGHREDAEDVMQEALLKTYQYVQHISEPEAFRTWLYRTVRNACLMKRRRHVGEPSHFVTTPIDIADRSLPIDQKLIDEAMDSRVRDAMSRLPAVYRMIIVMREVEGLSTRETADITGFSEANVKTRLRRARLMLRREMLAGAEQR